jgi:hypothetical protein
MKTNIKNRAPRNHAEEYQRRRLQDFTKDTEAKIKKDIAEWSAVDPVYGLIVEGILDTLRYRNNRD